MTLNDAQNGGQTKTASSKLRGEEGLEDVSFGFLVHPRSAVNYFQLQIGIGKPVSRAKQFLVFGWAQVSYRGADLYFAWFLADGLRSVDYEIHYDLLQLSRVALKGSEIGSEVQLQFNVLGNTGADQLRDFRDQIVEIDCLNDETAFACISEHLAGEERRTFTGVNHFTNVDAGWIVAGKL